MPAEKLLLFLKIIRGNKFNENVTLSTNFLRKIRNAVYRLYFFLREYLENSFVKWHAVWLL